MRDNLIELLSENFVDFCHVVMVAGNCKISAVTLEADKFADHLISLGVTIADVPDNNVGKWIPISERLPEPRRSIEMYFPSKEMVCLGFFEKVGPLDIWCVYTPNNANVCQIKPTHWRYRTIVPASPEPPKEGE